MSWSVVESGLNRTKDHPTAPEISPIQCVSSVLDRVRAESDAIVARDPLSENKQGFSSEAKIPPTGRVRVYAHAYTHSALRSHALLATFTHAHTHMRSHIHAHLRVRGYDLFIFNIYINYNNKINI